tara:strand:- start:1090 stop:1392 length:303 start_codon:yes stop_codon:yes gene_type:complete
VTASFLLYQFLDTSLLDGATTIEFPEDLHIKYPPSTLSPKEQFPMLKNPKHLHVPESLIQPVAISLHVPESLTHTVDASLQVPESFIQTVITIPQSILLV